MWTIDTRGALDFSAGLIAYAKWEGAQALCAAQHNERYAFVVFAIARDPDGSTIRVVFYGSTAEKVAMMLTSP